MTAIERDNPALKDVLPRDYARPALDKARLLPAFIADATELARFSAEAPDD